MLTYNTYKAYTLTYNTYKAYMLTYTTYKAYRLTYKPCTQAHSACNDTIPIQHTCKAYI